MENSWNLIYIPILYQNQLNLRIDKHFLVFQFSTAIEILFFTPLLKENQDAVIVEIDIRLNS